VSVSLFSHSANPEVDPRLCRKSNSYVAQLVREGRAFMIDERRAQLYGPLENMTTWNRPLQRPALISGRNSCRKVRGPDGEALYRLKHFSYPIPAVGGRNRRTPAAVINAEPGDACG
jgi:hypothetical protein